MTVWKIIRIYQSSSLSLSRRFNTITYYPNARFHETELFIYLCKRVWCVCILLRRAHNKEKMRRRGQKMKTSKRVERKVFSKFVSFFCPLSLLEYFFLSLDKFSFFSLEVFFKKNQNHTSKNDTANNAFRSRLRIVLYIVNTIRRQTQHFFELAVEELSARERKIMRYLTIKIPKTPKDFFYSSSSSIEKKTTKTTKKKKKKKTKKKSSRRFLRRS